ncbi:MAG: type II secretion system GspH family protein, partial [Leptospira sp.]|nr:type II secretion system GspH family protein [Leptospira sp.]
MKIHIHLHSEKNNINLPRSVHRRGLTLVEIGVSIMVIGVLMAMVASSLSNFIRPSSTDVSEKIKSALVFCYETAILNNQTVILDIDIEEDKYTA